MTYSFGLNFDASDQVSGFPVKHANSSLTLHTQKHAVRKTLGLESHIEAPTNFLEVLEDLDTGG